MNLKRVERAVAVTNQKPKPRDGISVFSEAYAAAYFKQMAPGRPVRDVNGLNHTLWRSFRSQVTAAMHQTAATNKDRINELIGTSPTSTTERLNGWCSSKQGDWMSATQRMVVMTSSWQWRWLATSGCAP